MQETDSSDKKKLLQEDKHKINQTHHTSADHSNGHVFYSESKKKEGSKKKLWIGLGIAAAVIIAVVVTLCVVLIDNEESGPLPPNPPTPPPGPIIFYNNYTISNDSLRNTGDTYSGYIIQNGNYNKEVHSAALTRLFQGLPKGENNQHYYSVNPNYIPTGLNNQLINNVSFMFSMNNYKVGYMRLTDANNERYSIPNEAVNGQYINPTMRLEMLGFQLYSNPFSFSFTDVADQSNVFVHTNQSSFVFMDKYIQMDFQLPSQRVFGLGERVREFRLGEGTWTMWAKGADSPYDDGQGGLQVYGVHPFALIQGKNKGDFFGLFFRNSNAQSPLLKYNAGGTSTLSYITTGGQLEVFFFIHGSAKGIIQQYQNLVGNPNLPPFWSLGWQQASWKYLNQSMVEDVVAQYKSHDLPLDVMWLDIPYMKDYADFSVDTQAFPNIKGLADNLHSNDQKLVVILDAGLSADDLNNKYYKAAQQYDILIKSSINKDVYNGALVMKVWPNQTVFIDWFNKDAYTVWSQGLTDLYNLVPYDGLWLDMSEPTGFCNGECPTKATQDNINAQTVEKVVRQLSETLEADQTGNDFGWYYSYPDQSSNSTYYLPFIPGYNIAGNLDVMTMSLNATNPSIGQPQYNVHSLYGLMMAKTTKKYLTENSNYANTDNRPFVLTRSTFSGSGSYTSHWLGDNWRDWGYMNYSIAGIMNMNMFGIPQAGADVCGFFGEKRDDEMCARWIQLAAFYPFARAHQNLTWKGEDSERSEPYLLADPWIGIARDALYKRYQYLRHYYTCLFEVSQWGGTCFDPLFYYYPTDDNLFENIEQSFLIGGALKVSPILNAGVSTTGTYKSYFPAGVWVNIDNLGEVIDTTSGGKMVDLSAKYLNAHLRSGSILPFQDNTDVSYKTVESLNDSPKVSLYVNRDQDSFAAGSLLLDKGISRAEIYNNQYEYLQFEHSSKSITKLQAAGSLNAQPDFQLDEVRILNAVDLEDTNFACYMDMNFQPVLMDFEFVESGKYLRIYGQNTINFDQFKMIYYGNYYNDVNLCDPNAYHYVLPEQVIPDLTGTYTTFLLMNYMDTLPDINVTLQMMAPNIVNIKWTFADLVNNKAPFEVPKNLINVKANAKGAALSNFVTISDTPYFTISINSLQGNKVIDFGGMVFDEYLNIINQKVYQTKSDFHGIMGLGEKAMSGLFYETGVYSYWALDTANPTETGVVPGNNLYGTHPFYMFKSASSVWTGVFTNLAAASDWYIYNEAELGYTNITTVAIGGVADIYVIIGYDPKQVAADYHNYIVGRPVLIPVYALGWNQCKWGYKNTSQLQEVLDQYFLNDIPLDNMWSDIDYLNAYRDFTYDTLNFGDLPKFISELYADDLHYIPIIDAGIAMRPWGNYTQYTQAVDADIFIKANLNNSEDFVGYVWPNQANYPDWYHPNVSNWYVNSLQYLHDTLGIAFDGLWLDMNEASNFCSGPCFQSQAASNSVKGKLKYIPTNRDLETKSIAIDAVHYGDILEIDTHSLYGAQEVYNAYQYFQANDKRTFIIERSSFAGMGKYGSVWLGDNFSDIKYLEYSIGGTMLMGLFGIPLAGADICGFIGDTTPELCARWTVAGAFYPFSRNHNNYGQKPQEPYQFADDIYEGSITYMDIMRTGIRNKYHMIRYYYTEMFKMSVFGTGPFFNPLFFHFPDDDFAFMDISNNIMLGGALKLSVLTNALGVNSYDFYFPQGIWCNVFVPTEACLDFSDIGQKQTLTTKAYDFYVHIYEGHIVPLQDATAIGISSTIELTNHPVDFHILGSANALGYTWYSSGSYINDDGKTLNVAQNYNQYSIVAMANETTPTNINISISQVYVANNYADVVEAGCSAVNQNDFIGNFYIYNAEDYTGMKFDVKVIFDDKTSVSAGQASHNSNTNRIESTPLNLCMTKISVIQLTLAP